MTILKDFKAGTMRVRIFESRAAMGDFAGKQAADLIKNLLAEKDEINVMFAAAPSQNETLATLCADSDIDWARVNAFHMDEYVGLPADHPAGFRNFLKRSIFDRFTFKSISLLDGNAMEPKVEAVRYAGLLETHPLDICLLGVGENGHIAFNDPPVADFHDPLLVKVVELEERCRVQQVNDGCFAKLTDVPAYALSVTIPGLFGAKAMFCTVPSATKADAIRNMLDGTVTTQCPASILTTHANASLYLDSDSGRYFLQGVRP